MDVVGHGLTPVGTGASSKEGTASTKEVPAREWSGEVRLGGHTTNKFNGLGLGRVTRGREVRAVLGWSSGYSFGEQLDPEGWFEGGLHWGHRECLGH